MDDACPFCRIVAGSAPAHLVAETAGTVAFLDARPVFRGHTLVVPRRHHDTLLDVPADELQALVGEVQVVARAVEAGLGAEGSFVAVNNRVSQSVPHLHVHVVPRRRKDGLRGFFWPRQRYAGDDDARAVAASLAAAVADARGDGGRRRA